MYKIAIFTIITLMLSGCTLIKKLSSDSNQTQIQKQTPSKKVALLVGVSDYSPYSSDLPGIDTDITNIQSIITKWGFDDIKVLYNKDSLKLEKELKRYKKNLKPNDIFLFFYSGHGSYTDDLNGDEDDGRDETIVLSDGSENMHFLDDDLYYYFSHIKAKKLIMFDSCHSGTAYKSLNSKFVSKSILPRFVDKIISTDIKGSDTISGEYIVLSAAQDNEESLATTNGSLFTTTLTNLLNENNSSQKSFQNIRDNITDKIVNICQKADLPPHHPKLSVSKEVLKNSTVKQYLELK